MVDTNHDSVSGVESMSNAVNSFVQQANRLAEQMQTLADIGNTYATYFEENNDKLS